MRKSSFVFSMALSMFGGCGPAPEPKPVSASILTDGPQAQSTEWLYATPGSSGVVKEECKIVVGVLKKEQGCSGDLCRHAIHLGKDWLNTCKEFERGQVPAVTELLATFQKRARLSGGECAFRGAEFIDQGCPEAADCALLAQEWATKCSDQATPLVVTMIERQIERSTQTPVQLDTTSCAEHLAKLTKSPSCGNDFECEEKVAKLKNYRARCLDMNQPLPLDQALKQALLLQSARQQPPPFLVSDPEFPPERGRLMFEDKSGFVVSVGDQPASNVNLLIKTLRDSEYTLAVQLARVFSDERNRHELRLGSIDVPDAETFFRRYASLELQGQDEALGSHIANATISRLNEVVKNLHRQRVAVAGLISALGPATPVQNDTELQTEIAKADKHLVKVFEGLARDKRLELPKSWVRGERMRDRVAYARRSWRQPFADVTGDGQVELGAVNPAIAIDVERLLPASFSAYRENMDGTIGRALRTLEPEFEQQLLSTAQTRAKHCAETRKSIQRQEQRLLGCAFGVQNCSEDKVAKAGAELDEAIAAHAESRDALHFALLQLEKPPTGPLEQTVDECFE